MLEDLDQDLVDDLFLVSFSGYFPLFAFVLCLEFKVQYILNSRLCCLQHVNPATPPVAPRFVRPTYNPSGNQEWNNITVTKENQPKKTYETKPTQPNLPNQPNQSYQTKPKLPNLAKLTLNF